MDEIRNQLKDQEKINQEQCSATKRLEIELSLLCGECERIEYLFNILKINSNVSVLLAKDKMLLFFCSQEKKSMIHKVHSSDDLKREYHMLRGKQQIEFVTTHSLKEKLFFFTAMFFQI